MLPFELVVYDDIQLFSFRNFWYVFSINFKIFVCVVLDLDELIPENTIQCVFTFSESLLTLSHFRRKHHT